jgi:hypothetical protein
MGSYVLRHAVTGMALPGYVVQQAEEGEIERANHNLARRSSPFRFEALAVSAHQPKLDSVPTLAAESIP